MAIEYLVILAYGNSLIYFANSYKILSEFRGTYGKLSMRKFVSCMLWSVALVILSCLLVKYVIAYNVALMYMSGGTGPAVILCLTCVIALTLASVFSVLVFILGVFKHLFKSCMPIYPYYAGAFIVMLLVPTVAFILSAFMARFSVGALDYVAVIVMLLAIGFIAIVSVLSGELIKALDEVNIEDSLELFLEGSKLISYEGQDYNEV